jgi:glycosyltransferase involved in cell wall biosynthesis
MKSLRIAIYHNLHSGGAKRMVSEQAHRLTRQHHVQVFSLTHADHSFARRDGVQEVGTTLIDYHPLPMARSPFGRLNPVLGLYNVGRLDVLARQCAALIDSQRFDVVLVHPCQVTHAPLVLRWLKTPTLYYCHEWPRKLYEPAPARPYGPRSRLRGAIDSVDPLRALNRVTMRWLDYACVQKSTAVATNSHYTQRNIANAYHRVAHVCFPGVDAIAFQPCHAEREFFVLSVGALTPAKGFDDLIRALGTLPVVHRPHLVIVSNYQESAEVHYLTGLAEQCGVVLEYRVGISEQELQDLYARAGCIAYAPLREPFGMIVLEAMAAGVPVVSIAEGGVCESVVDGVNGLLAPREPKSFGDAVQYVLSHPEYARQLGSRAREMVLEQWTWDQHIAVLDQLLQQTIG